MIVHVAILGATCEAAPIGGERSCVHGTEVTMDFDQLFAQNNVEHLHFEATSLFVCRCHITSILTACQDRVELLMLVRIEKWRNNS